jgi:hypothetical protein
VRLSEIGERTAAATIHLAEQTASYIEACADDLFETARRKHAESYARARATREQAQTEAAHQVEYARRLYEAGIAEDAARERFYAALPVPEQPRIDEVAIAGETEPEFREGARAEEAQRQAMREDPEFREVGVPASETAPPGPYMRSPVGGSVG